MEMHLLQRILQPLMPRLSEQWKLAELPPPRP
jgi:hypothetical protein